MMRRRECAFATRFHGRVTQILSDGKPGAGRSFRCGHPYLKRSRDFIPLHTPNSGDPVGLGGHDFGLAAAPECPAGAIAGKLETDGGAVDRFAGLIADLDGEASCGARSGAVNRPIALDDAQLNDYGCIGREKTYGQNDRDGPPGQDRDFEAHAYSVPGEPEYSQKILAAIVGIIALSVPSG